MKNYSFNEQQGENSVRGGARSQGPDVSCRITSSDEGEGFVVRSVFPSVLARQGNIGDETVCRLSPQASRTAANTRYDNLEQSRRGTERLATQANYRT